jgi:hypothetical protein
MTPLSKHMTQASNYSLGIVALTLLLSCSDSSCTLVGCQSGLLLEYPSAEWPEGEYNFQVEAGDLEASCTVELDHSVDPESTPDGLTSAPCTPSESLWLAVNLRTGGIDHIELFDAPDAVRVMIRFEGARLHEQTVEPQYQAVEPNGPGCGPVCRGSSEALDLPDFE